MIAYLLWVLCAILMASSANPVFNPNILNDLNDYTPDETILSNDDLAQDCNSISLTDHIARRDGLNACPAHGNKYRIPGSGTGANTGYQRDSSTNRGISTSSDDNPCPENRQYYLTCGGPELVHHMDDTIMHAVANCVEGGFLTCVFFHVEALSRLTLSAVQTTILGRGMFASKMKYLNDYCCVDFFDEVRLLN